MNVRHPNIIHHANVGKVMRSNSKKEWEFGQFGRRIKYGKIGSDVTVHLELDEEPYCSPDEKQDGFKVQIGHPLPWF